MPLVNEALVVISPEHMVTLARGGVRSKALLAEHLWHQANRASSRQLIRTLTLAKPSANRVVIVCLGAALIALAFCLSLLADLIAYLAPHRALQALPLHSVVVGRLLQAPKFTSPQSFHILVAGGSAGKFSAFCPGFGIGVPPRSTAKLSQACSAPVEPPPATLEAESTKSDLRSELAPPSAPPSFAALSDPTAGRGSAAPLAPSARPELMDSCGVLGLLDISKAGGNVLLDCIEARLKRDHPRVTCKRFRKPTFSRPMPAELASTIGRECGAVVSALAD